MGKFRKISLVIFYALQVLVVSQESFGLIYEGALHDASLALLNDGRSNPLMILFQRPNQHHAHPNSSVIGAKNLDDGLKYEEHDRDTHEPAEGHSSACDHGSRRRRLAIVLIRNLFSETRKIEPTAAVPEVSSRRTSLRMSGLARRTSI